MNFTDLAFVFDCNGMPLIGVATKPDRPKSLGVVIVVGGPQYRVGSHRQFVLLARALATNGYPVLRFDYRGMGDSEGTFSGFESLDDDIGAAIDALQRKVPEVEHVVLWGLCDGASASLLYCGNQIDAGRVDARIFGLCLLNPWVRSYASLARTHLKHYYSARLFEKTFWDKVFKGQFSFGGALNNLIENLIRSRQTSSYAPTDLPFQKKMALAMRKFPRPVLLILSGNDLTAKEFLDNAMSDPDWAGTLEKPSLTIVNFVEADHTFSSAKCREGVEQTMLQWIDGLAMN